MAPSIFKTHAVARLALRVSIWMLTAYLTIFGVAMVCGCTTLVNSLLFPRPPPTYADDAQVLKLRTADGQRISAIYSPVPSPRKTLLFSHGNGEDIGHYLRQYLKGFNEIGLSTFAYDYAGYGTSEGTPSEEAAYQDINAAYDYLIAAGVAPRDIILYGRSIGSGPSIDLASRREIGGLICEGAFVSAFRVVTGIPLVPFDRFKNLSKISAVSCPKLFIHGERDEIVPFWHGEALYDAAPGPKQCFWVPSAGHNDLVSTAGGRYWDEISAFVETLKR